MGKDLIKILKKNIHWILLILFTIVIVIVINNQFKNKESFRISAADLRIENMTRTDFFELLEKMIKNASDVNIVINGQNITNDILKLVNNIIDNEDKITKDIYQDLYDKYIKLLQCTGNGDGFSIGAQPDDEDWAPEARAFALGVGDLNDEQAGSLLVGLVIVIGGSLVISNLGVSGVGILIAAFVAKNHADEGREWLEDE